MKIEFKIKMMKMLTDHPALVAKHNSNMWNILNEIHAVVLDLVGSVTVDCSIVRLFALQIRSVK